LAVFWYGKQAIAGWQEEGWWGALTYVGKEWAAYEITDPAIRNAANWFANIVAQQVGSVDYETRYQSNLRKYGLKPPRSSWKERRDPGFRDPSPVARPYP